MTSGNTANGGALAQNGAGIGFALTNPTLIGNVAARGGALWHESGAVPRH